MTATAVSLIVSAGLLAWSARIGDGFPDGRPGIGSETPLTAMDQSVGPANNSPMLVADPKEPAFLVLTNRLDAPIFGCALHVSGDGGRSWAPADPVSSMPAGAERCYAPEAAFGADGTLYYLFVGLAGAGNEPVGAFLATSVDRARTFSAPRRVLGPRNFGVRMAIDPNRGQGGRIHLVWLHARSEPALGGFGPGPNPILAAHSDNGGRSFSKPVQVSDPDRTRVVAPALAVAPDGAVHVGYYDLMDDAVDYQGLEGPVWDGRWSLVSTRSSEGGKRFGPGVVAEANVVPHERVMLVFTMAPPSLVVGTGRACLAWADGRHGDADVFVRCSADGGLSWSRAVRVNDDKVGNGKSQVLPRLGLSPGGRLDVIFYDRRIDVRNLVNEVFYAASGNGGRRFGRNSKVSTEGSFSLIGQRYLVSSAAGQVEFGSRLGLWSADDQVVAAWADTRNSRPNTTGQDIFATVLTFPATESSSTTARLVGAVALAISALAFAAAAARGPGYRQPTEAL